MFVSGNGRILKSFPESYLPLCFQQSMHCLYQSFLPAVEKPLFLALCLAPRFPAVLASGEGASMSLGSAAFVVKLWHAGKGGPSCASATRFQSRQIVSLISLSYKQTFQDRLLFIDHLSSCTPASLPAESALSLNIAFHSCLLWAQLFAWPWSEVKIVGN